MLVQANAHYNFWREYSEHLVLLAGAVATPAYSEVPEVLKDPGLGLVYSDLKGGHLIRLTSQSQADRFSVGHLDFECGSQGGFTVYPVFGSRTAEQFLFPDTAPDDQITVTIGEPYLVLKSLAFASPTYNALYWPRAKFARLVAAPVPFSVQRNGDVLAIDILHGFLRDGTAGEQLLEWVRWFGNSELINGREIAARDLAFQDFVRALEASDLPRTTWSFAKFLRDLATPVEQNVLILGSFRTPESLERVRQSLQVFGYHGFTLLDAIDLPIQSNLEKFYAGVLASMFVIVVDVDPSGHLQEVAELLEKRFRPVIVVRDAEKPTTWFSEDRLRSDPYFRIIDVRDIEGANFASAVRWARDVVAGQINRFNAINHWR